MPQHLGGQTHARPGEWSRTLCEGPVPLTGDRPFCYSLFVMPTKREYLVEKGLAKPGHGRFSGTAKEAIKDAINKGVKFDYPGQETGVDATPEPRRDRPEGYYTFRNPDGTTFKRLHTEACIECQYSFQWCKCAKPTQWAYDSVLGEVAVLHRLPKSVITTADVPEKQPQQGTRRGRPRKGK